MKRWFVIAIVLVLLVFLNACGDPNARSSQPEPSDFREWVAWSIEKIDGVKVNEIVINDHTGSADPNDKIALIYVNCKNIDTKKFQEYSDTMFKTVYDKYPIYQEFVIFWSKDGDNKTTFKCYNERSETSY